MHRMTLMIAEIAVVVLLLGADAMAKDLTMRQRTRSGAANAKMQEETVYWTAAKRISDTPHKRTIADFDKQTFTSLNKDKQTFTVWTFTELRSRDAYLRKQMEHLPAKARQLTGPLLAPPTLRATGRVEQILGYDAKEYAVDGSMTGSVWMSETIDVAAAAQEWAKIAVLLGGPQSPARAFMQAVAQVKGVPLRSTVNIASGSGRVTSTTEVTEIAEQPAPADFADIPPGFVPAPP